MLMDIEENVKSLTINADDDSYLETKRKRIYKDDRSPFSIMGPTRNKKARRFKMGLNDKLITVSRAAEILYVTELSFKVDENTGVVTMKEWEKLDASKLRSVYRKIAELRDAEILVDIKPIEGKIHKPPKFTYLLNPYYTKPKEYVQAKRAWELLGGKPV